MSQVAKPRIVSRTEWGCPDGQLQKSALSWKPKTTTLTHFIIHHTATPNDDNFYRQPDGRIRWVGRVQNIWSYHARADNPEKGKRPWGDIGYNFLIDADGVIYQGRAGSDNDEDIIGGHAGGGNLNTVGISLIGNFRKVEPSEAALESLIQLIAWKATARSIDPLGSSLLPETKKVMQHISGHLDVSNNTVCPGEAFYALLPHIREQAALRLEPLPL